MHFQEQYVAHSSDYDDRIDANLKKRIINSNVNKGSEMCYIHTTLKSKPFSPNMPLVNHN